MNKLKKLKSTTDKSAFCSLLGLKASFLTHILYGQSIDSQYHSFEISKKSGGSRKICAPSEQLKDIQQRLSNLLLDCKYTIHKTHLSHGFERERSIITNAHRHIKKKNVLNIDLENFFDSFNFGRVRGFFIKNKKFLLHPKIATIIAQIACYNNALPQGSPCSPVIANLITNSLDIDLNKIVKNHGCSYSRYADDITISTRKTIFPIEIVRLEGLNIILGDKILKQIKRAGFSVNDNKTRIQFKNSRQDATGLIINKKVNIKSEYWREVRAMAHSLFTKGEYIVDGSKTDDLLKLEGKLSFIDSIDKFNNFERAKQHSQKPYYQLSKIGLDYLPKFNVREKTYSKFLYYKYFHGNDFPTILTEGKTDVIYLKCALNILGSNYFIPSSISEEKTRFPINFFRNTKRMKYFLELDGGSNFLKKFTERYSDYHKYYPAHAAKSPVIMILDNDSGQNALLKDLSKRLNKTAEIMKSSPFLHVCHNLYLILTPLKNGEDTSMEDLFPQKVLNKKINGKSFNKSNDHCTENQYGKHIFSQQIILNQHNLTFHGFKPILKAVKDVIAHYNLNRLQLSKG